MTKYTAVASRNVSISEINLGAVKSIKGDNHKDGNTYEITRYGREYELTIWAYSWTLGRKVAIDAGIYSGATEMLCAYPELAEVSQWITRR